MSLDDSVRRARDGDAAAFEEIVRVHQRAVRMWIIARCPPGEDADDVAQNTFVQVFKRLKEYQPGTEFRAWLFTIARYQLMTALTTRRRLADYRNRYAPAAFLTALERTVSGETPREEARLDHLKTCLSKMEEGAREIVRLRYGDDASLETIAERTGRSAAAIRQLLFTLRRKLHDCIQARLADEVSG